MNLIYVPSLSFSDLFFLMLHQICVTIHVLEMFNEFYKAGSVLNRLFSLVRNNSRVST